MIYLDSYFPKTNAIRILTVEREKLNMASKKVWSKEETIDLIHIYEENSVLWNSKCKEYRNREIKDSILRNVSQKFNCTSEEIQRKLHNLRNQVR